MIALVKFEPETVNDCAADAVPNTVLNAVNVPPVTLTEAAPTAVTVPLTATFADVGPLTKVTLADARAPSAVLAAILTEIVPLTAPAVCVKVLLPAKVAPSVATSKPVGAVTVTSADKFAPVTVNVCAADAVPAVVVKPVKVETEGVRLGDEEEPAGVTSAQVVPYRIAPILRVGAAVLDPCRRAMPSIPA